MIVIPAIDIKDGRVVRLRRGDFAMQKVYSSDPCAVACEWKAQGARYMHLVDLDGAVEGRPRNYEIIKKIIQETGIPSDLGGGLREEAMIEDALNLGVDRAIVSTRAVCDIDFLKSVVTRFGPEKIAVSVDSKDDTILVEGWTKTSAVATVEYVRELDRIGVRYVIYTNIKNDGMLSGPDVAMLKVLLEATRQCRFISSGGIASIDDLKTVDAMGERVFGAIVGKALYEGNIVLREAIEAIC